MRHKRQQQGDRDGGSGEGSDESLGDGEGAKRSVLAAGEGEPVRDGGMIGEGLRAHDEEEEPYPGARVLRPDPLRSTSMQGVPAGQPTPRGYDIDLGGDMADWSRVVLSR